MRLAIVVLLTMLAVSAARAGQHCTSSCMSDGFGGQICDTWCDDE
jgi:hypothetical protein